MFKFEDGKKVKLTLMQKEILLLSNLKKHRLYIWLRIHSNMKRKHMNYYFHLQKLPTFWLIKLEQKHKKQLNLKRIKQQKNFL